MSTQPEDQFDGDLGEGDPGDPKDPANPTNDDWARQRQQLARERAARKEAEKNLAFRDAGLDPKNNPQHARFMKGYDGKLEPDEIRQVAIAEQFLPKPADPVQDPEQQAANAAAADGLAQVDAAADGAAPPKGGDPINRLDEAYLAGGDSALDEAVRQSGYPVRDSS